MIEANSSEVSSRFEAFREHAEGGSGRAPEPVLVMHDSKPSVVIVDASEWDRLKRRDKISGRTEDLPEYIVQLVAAARMEERFDDLDDE